jgi:hypothetical protein
MYGDYEEKIKVREQGDGCEVGGVLEVNEEKICWNDFRINMMRLCHPTVDNGCAPCKT